MLFVGVGVAWTFRKEQNDNAISISFDLQQLLGL
jgi:hypothetical protein